MAMEPQRALLVFHLASQVVALPLENVESIAPMAQLSRPPGLPSPLEGVLNLGGRAVPVWRLARLLQLPEQRPGLYSMIIILKRIPDAGTAMLVDRVTEILSVPEIAMIPIADEDSFNGCVEATVPAGGQAIHLLSLERVLLKKEREALSEFQAIEQRRTRDWEPARH